MGSFLESINKGIIDFAQFDSRGIGMTAKDKEGHTLKLLEVPTPAWFPDSYLRSLKRNLYYNMINNASYAGKSSLSEANDGKSLDFYKDTSGDGLISNMLNTAVKSVVSVAANQVMSITSKVDSVINGVSSLLTQNTTSQSLLSMINETAQNPFLASQPYLKIYGIHLAEKVRDNWNLVSDVFKNAKSALSSFQSLLKGDMKGFKEYWKGTEESLKLSLQQAGMLDQSLQGGTFEETLSNHLLSPEFRMHGFSEVQMLASITGTYTMTCKLPYFGNGANIIESSGDRAFKTGYGFSRENSDGLGHGTSGIGELAKKITGVTTAWSNAVEWLPEHIFQNNPFTPASYQFHIYNDTLEHMLTNLVFIWSFGAANMSVTDTFSLRPPYLFDIEVPGGFRYRYCTCHLKVVPRGKLRKTSSIKIDEGDGKEDAIKILFKQIYGFDVNPQAIAFVPDFYEITVNFTSLLPNMWNFIDTYLHNGSQAPKVGEQVKTMLTKFVNDFTKGA